MSIEDFVADVIEDKTGGMILPIRAAEVVEEMAKAVSATTKRKSSDSGNDSAGAGATTTSPIAKLKAIYLQEQEEIKEGKEPSSKRAKTILADQLDAYEKYKDLKNSQLDDVLGWNNQFKTGNKDVKLAKIVDGHVYGRLQRCNLCGGHLKLADDGKCVVCNGQFDEDTQRRIPCHFTCPPVDAPRWKPWYETEPSEEEKEEMAKQIDEYSEAGGVPTGKAESGNADKENLLVLVSDKEWNLADGSGRKAAATEIRDIIAKEGTLNLPQNKKDALVEIFKVLNVNRDKSPDEIISLLIERFGFVKEKKAKAEQKEAAIKGIAACSANVGVIAALQELADLYFKEGNRNAGGSYIKAVQAIKDIDFEITAENAKGLGKGKTKIQNIGKSTAEKIFEFASTGTIEKLEEKRANAA